MHRAVLLLAIPLVLAGCGRRHHDETTTTVTKDGVTTTTVTRTTRHGGDDGDKTVSGLNIDTDKFKANLEIPGLTFGADDMDMDGMKLYPGSKVRGIRVKASKHDGDEKGVVTMDFTSPAAPAAVVAHMTAEAKKAGFTVSGVTPAGLSGIKVEDKDTNRFTVTLNASGDATAGQLEMSGSKAKGGWN